MSVKTWNQAHPDFYFTIIELPAIFQKRQNYESHLFPAKAGQFFYAIATSCWPETTQCAPVCNDSSALFPTVSQ